MTRDEFVAAVSTLIEQHTGGITTGWVLAFDTSSLNDSNGTAVVHPDAQSFAMLLGLTQYAAHAIEHNLTEAFNE